MPAVFGRRRRLLVVYAGAFVLAAALAASSAGGETLTVSIDKAHIMKMPERVATIVIGNPLVADASLQPGGILVITAKGYGATNLLGLDRAGKVVMNDTVQVQGPASSDLVVVYKGVERETYSCAPECQHRLTLGDSAAYFNGIVAQAGSRTAPSQGAAGAGGSGGGPR